MSRLDFSFLGDGAELWRSLGDIKLKRVSSKFQSLSLVNVSPSVPLDNLTIVDGEEMSLWVATATTTHLTSFAVLLGSSPQGSLCNNRVIWILSVSFLAASIG